MNIALKEWAVVIAALGEGRQVFLLRKGGIAEGKRGFELRHQRFLLFPTWEHQHREALQPEWRERFDALEPPDASAIELRYFAEAHDIVPAPTNVEAFLQLSDSHVWTAPFFQKRYEYRPDLPLFVVAVRTYTLPEPVSPMIGAIRGAGPGWISTKTCRSKARNRFSMRTLSCKPGLGFSVVCRQAKT